MSEKSYGEMVLDRIEQLDEEFLKSQREIEVTTDEGTGHLRPQDYESYKLWLIQQYPPRFLQLPDGTLTYDSPAIMLLRDFPKRILNHDDVWPDIKKALGVK